MTPPAKPFDPDTRARIEVLVCECLEGPEDSLDERIESRCREHPELADAVRRRCTILRELGFTPQDNGDEPPREFGPYRLLRRLGRGGMGVVYEAEHTGHGRRVALKLLQPGLIEMGKVRERFRRELRIATRLEHPGICTVYDSGEVDGRPYLAMQLLDGPTLADVIATAQQLRGADGGPSTETPGSELAPTTQAGVHRLLELGEKVARALHFAHEQGLIHRDVKPGNIIVGADGDPVVLDFGLARTELLDEETLTLSGDLLGTPAYMSPEQLLAQRVPLDRRTDVYSLGATLYECLTLTRPFEGTSRAHLYQQILHSEPPGATTLNRLLPREVQTVLATAMEKDRNRRYPTALAFAEDLARLRQKLPIRARPIGRVLRLRRWMQRYPAATALVASLFVGLVLTLYLLGRLADSQTDLQASNLANAFWNNRSTDPGLSALLAMAAVDKAQTPETVAAARALLTIPAPIAEFPAGAPRMNRCVVSPDKRFAVWCGRSGEAEVWDLEAAASGQTNATHSLAVQDSWAPDLAFAPDSRRFAVAGNDFEPFVNVFDLDGQRLARPGPFAGGVIAVDWHPSRDLLVVGTREWNEETRNGIYLWDLASDEMLWSTLDRHEGPEDVAGWPWNIRFDDSGARIVSAQGGGHWPRALPAFTDFRVRVWNLEGRCLDWHDEHRAKVHTMVVRDGVVLTLGFDRRAVYWPFARSEDAVVYEHAVEVTGGDLSPFGEGYATTGMDGIVRVIGPEGRLMSGFPTEEAFTRGLLYTPGGKSVVVKTVSNQFYEHDLSGRILAQFGVVNSTTPGIKATFLSEDRLLAWENLWSASIWSLHGHLPRPLAMPNLERTWPGRNGWTASKVGHDELVVARDGRPVCTISEAGINAAGFSADGELLALGFLTGEVKVYRAADGELVGAPGRRQRSALRRVEFSGDGTGFLTLNQAGAINLYERFNEGSWRHVGWLRHVPRLLNNVELLRAPGGTEWWICGTSSQGVRLWRIEDKERRPLDTEEVDSVYEGGAFGLDVWNDQRLLVGCNDGMLRLFDLTETGTTQLRTFRVDYGAQRVAFSPDGSRVLGLGSNSIHVWTDTGDLLALVRHPRHGRFSFSEFTANSRGIVTIDTRWRVRSWPIEDENVLGPARTITQRLRPYGFTQAERRRFAELLR